MISIIVHGGAGDIGDKQLEECRLGCREALLQGWKVLLDGGSALDAVEGAVISMENNPIFNAGVGSVLNREGYVECDAAIMDGETLSAGAVAAVSSIKNPITLARKIMEDGRHILLAGKGAEDFGRNKGIELCWMEDLITERERERWSKKQISQDSSTDTVGAVALDAQGKIAVGVSTGGIAYKHPGRVGDSAIIGAGIYADNSGGACCTGLGEGIMKVLMAKVAVDFLKGGHNPQEAAELTVRVLEERVNGKGGLIVLDKYGRFGIHFNTKRMTCAYIQEGMKEPVVFTEPMF